MMMMMSDASKPASDNFPHASKTWGLAKSFELAADCNPSDIIKDLCADVA